MRQVVDNSLPGQSRGGRGRTRQSQRVCLNWQLWEVDRNGRERQKTTVREQTTFLDRVKEEGGGEEADRQSQRVYQIWLIWEVDGKQVYKVSWLQPSWMESKSWLIY